MEIEVRLRQLLQEHRIPTRGVAREIGKAIGVSQGVISKLLRNEYSNPSLDTLGKVSDWLIRKGVPPSRLPQSLLGHLPPRLWETCAWHDRVVLYLGMYRQKHPVGPPTDWVSQRDSMVANVITQMLSDRTYVGERFPRIETVYTQISHAYKKGRSVDVAMLGGDMERAKKKFKWMRTPGTASIVVASMKANLLTECFVANLFGCKPFEKSDRVPFYLQYRSFDRAVVSCFGGLSSRPSTRGKGTAGTHYRVGGTKWETWKWVDRKNDAGIVITRYEPSSNRLEIALFGFTSWATLALTEQLQHEASSFWPPYASAGNHKVGVYICKYAFGTDHQQEDCDIVKIPADILESTLARQAG